MIPYLQHTEETKRIWCKYHKSRVHRYKDEISGVEIQMRKIPLQNGKIEFICDDCLKQYELKLWWHKVFGTNRKIRIK